jgi:hypothetical protein
MRAARILACTALVLGAASVRAEMKDPEIMANAIREAGRECNEVTSMKQSENPQEAHVYHVVCDEENKYKVLWQEDDTVLVEND